MASSPYGDDAALIALPHVSTLALAPGGATAVLGVATLTDAGDTYETRYWSIRTDGSADPVELPMSTRGAGSVGFTPSGELLVVASVGDAAPQVRSVEDTGSDAARTDVPGGVGGIVARTDDVLVVSVDVLPSATSLEENAELRRAREESGIRAVLHERSPARSWNAEIGPTEPHLLAVTADGVRDLTPHPGRGAGVGAGVLTRDGRTLVVALTVPERRAGRRILVAIDTATGDRRTLVDEERTGVSGPTISGDGRTIAYLRSRDASPERVLQDELWILDLASGERRRIGADWDRWPGEPVFDLDDAAVLVIADDGGSRPLFRVPIDGGPVERVTHDAAAYSAVRVDAESRTIVALRSSPLAPPHPVRIERDGSAVPLPTPAPVPPTPAVPIEIHAEGTDRAPVRALLVLPHDADAVHPAPLLVLLHGGPLGSWAEWDADWCVPDAVARGWAVLLPDPALSTGYGSGHIARGWNAWGGHPFTDVLALTDAAVARDDVDATRTAALGPSFGGYLANWIAGHTDRFRAIVTHAGIWSLPQQAATSDVAHYWDREWSPEALAENSPDRAAAEIRAPMLVVHGALDYRVPIGQVMAQWSQLAAHHADERGRMPHRLLVFPDEGHRVESPRNLRVWRRTIFAFLDQHVLGMPWRQPEHVG